MIIKLKHQNPSTPADIGEYTTNQKIQSLLATLKKALLVSISTGM